MSVKFPPLSIVAVCMLSVASAAVQASRELPAAIAGVQDFTFGERAIVYAVPLALAAFFVFTLVGLWMMRRWALIVRSLSHSIAPIQMTLAWHDSWDRYPLLGPFVSWFWFIVFVACTLPHWGKMTWRFP